MKTLFDSIWEPEDNYEDAGGEFDGGVDPLGNFQNLCGPSVLMCCGGGGGGDIGYAGPIYLGGCSYAPPGG